MKRYASLIVIVCGLLAGTIAALWLTGRAPFHSAPPAEPLRNLASASAGAQPPHIKGAEAATVTLEEFADLQCPPCQQLHYELKQIENEYNSRLRCTFRHFPLSMHNHAFEAAQAAEAAALQNRFWEMHDLLYERQEQWEQTTNARSHFVEFARALGLDIARFTRDMDAPQVKERIIADQQRGESVNISGTPSLFINNHEVPSQSMTPEGIRVAINKVLNGK
ncbi:MAG: DsbA family protein [Pyrinomonadaceae bacterium]